jgi:hypothetical protein
MQDPASPRASGPSEFVLPHALPGQQRQRVERIRSLSLAERGELIVSACRTASLIEQSRFGCGLPPTRRAPWPASTLALLKKHSANAQ